MPIFIKAHEISGNPDISKVFLAVLENRLFETGKRRAAFGYAFIAFGVFFFLCHYFGITKVSFLGTEFIVKLGHIYWGATVSLSVLYFYLVFLFLQEMNILGIIHAIYAGLELPDTLLQKKILFNLLFPSPISFTFFTAKEGSSIFGLFESNKVLWLFEVVTTVLIGLLYFIAPLFVVLFFAYHGVQHSGCSIMLLPIIVGIICCSFVARAFMDSGVGWINFRSPNINKENDDK